MGGIPDARPVRHPRSETLLSKHRTLTTQVVAQRRISIVQMPLLPSAVIVGATLVLTERRAPVNSKQYIYMILTSTVDVDVNVLQSQRRGSMAMNCYQWIERDEHAERLVVLDAPVLRLRLDVQSVPSRQAALTGQLACHHLVLATLVDL
ncbi:hypothetical protein L226DRAFT_274832 [Lentinus tigrinus ALCF2SS1-7]|uniref:uncharacterized protein n=1 Tax=Lentinus tigrinus ALCF2SS1-7 TaxID=1328758 RepID=UPI0011662AB3|nr:hypothetical protein L226DRAFT_274832 [Lentinus tigrinus ALCF2SS1-7]